MAGLWIGEMGLCHPRAQDLALIAEHVPEAIHLLDHRPPDRWIASPARLREEAPRERPRAALQLRLSDAVEAERRADWEGCVAGIGRPQRDGLRVPERQVNVDKPCLVLEKLDAMIGDRPA